MLKPLCALVLMSSCLFADVSGTVFRDLPVNAKTLIDVLLALTSTFTLFFFRRELDV